MHPEKIPSQEFDQVRCERLKQILLRFESELRDEDLDRYAVQIPSREDVDELHDQFRQF